MHRVLQRDKNKATNLNGRIFAGSTDPVAILRRANNYSTKGNVNP